MLLGALRVEGQVDVDVEEKRGAGQTFTRWGPEEEQGQVGVASDGAFVGERGDVELVRMKRKQAGALPDLASTCDKLSTSPRLGAWAPRSVVREICTRCGGTGPVGVRLATVHPSGR